MSMSGVTLQARAWSACARPISPPQGVTAALFDMFCGLKGRTVRPRLVKARHSPAATNDLPASELVPCIMIAAIWCGPLELNTLLSFNARPEWMFHHRHFRYQIRSFDQWVLGVSACDNDVKVLRSVGEERHDLVERQVVVA